jgi:hypothetical protein
VLCVVGIGNSGQLAFNDPPGAGAFKVISESAGGGASRQTRPTRSLRVLKNAEDLSTYINLGSVSLASKSDIILKYQ